MTERCGTLNGLCDKEVINTENGCRMGYVCDVEVDLSAGKLTAILVPGEGGGFFSKPRDIRIPWEKILKIGEDTILVSCLSLGPEL